MPTPRDLISAIRAIILALWPLTTLAAGQSLGAAMSSFLFGDWIAVIVLSGVSGLVALLHRLRRSMEAAAAASEDTAKEIQRIDWRVYALVHMAGSLFAGVLAFLICEGFDGDRYLEAAIIALASWSGAKFADSLADGFSDSVRSRLAALISPKSGR